MKSKRWLLLAIALMMLFVTACGNTVENKEPNTTPDNVTDKPAEKAKVDGGIFVLAIGSDPNVMNPLYAGDRVTMTINNALFAPFICYR